MSDQPFSPAFSPAFGDTAPPAVPSQPRAGALSGAPCLACATCVPWQADMGCCDEWEGLDVDLQVRALDLAWATLRTLTGGRVGACAVTMRPCLGPPCDWCSPWMHPELWMMPRIVDGRWVNQVCGKGPCWCERICEIVMPGPVARVESIVVDGEELSPEQYRVDNGHRILRTDGECWPSCQHLDLPLDAIGTMGITYVPGIVPDPAGLWAAGVLACEFAKSCTGAKCRLPAAVTTVARQGVAMEMGRGLFPDGMTGIREVDAYITSVNPNAHRIPPTVWSPDVPWARHRYVETPPRPSVLHLTWCQGQRVAKTLTFYGVLAQGWGMSYHAPIHTDSVSYGGFDVMTTAIGDDLQVSLTLEAAASELIPPGDYLWELVETTGVTRLRGTAEVGVLVPTS